MPESRNETVYRVHKHKDVLRHVKSDECPYGSIG